MFRAVFESYMFVQWLDWFCCRKNTNCSIEEGLQRAHDILLAAKEANVRVRG